jgi:tryptophanyl-tRNA synthetase
MERSGVTRGEPTISDRAEGDGSAGLRSKRRVFSGVQPTGKLHIGNYIGALSVWAESQSSYENIFCIVDLHALTIPDAIRADYLHAKIREVATLYLASGIDTEQCAVFVQSHVPAHSELAWILNCVTPVGWLERMTQYKGKASQLESVGTGLLDYPVLQAADILLYNAHGVPVGEDQRQHVELTRDIAQRFNSLFGEVFVLPEAIIRDSGARIMGIDDPTIKMSKSLGERKQTHSIGLIDPPDVIRKTIMQAVTDSGNETRFDHAGPGVLNLLVLYEALSGEPREAIESQFDGKGYGTLKRTVSELVIEALEPIRLRYDELRADPQYIERMLADGADRVRPIAAETLRHVHDVTGIG